MRIVTLEEHISLPGFDKRINESAKKEHGWPDENNNLPRIQRVQHLLQDVENERIKSMDANGISMQVLSVTAPVAEVLEPSVAIFFCIDYNNALSAMVNAHQHRFSCFATLPVTAPADAANELERAITTLGFCGAMINGTTNGKFLDDAQFEPVLAKAEQLDVPIYIHPNLPPKAVMDAYYKGLPGMRGFQLSIAGFGWHAETAIHVLRMILAGSFDKHPSLKIIIGHMGEMLPMMMVRTNNVFKDAGLKRSISEVLKSQVYITTSGLFTQPPLEIAMETFGADNILFSVDYPYSTNEQGKIFLDEMQVSQADKEKIAHSNADNLLKLSN